MRRIGEGALALCSVLWLGSVQAITTTVVDLPTAGGTLRFVDTYPDAPIATILLLPGFPGTFEIQNDGSVTGSNAACNPVARNRTALHAHGFGVAMLATVSQGTSQAINPGTKEVVTYLLAQHGAPVWIVGSDAATQATFALANQSAADASIGVVAISPQLSTPGTAGNVERPVLVVYHALDTSNWADQVLSYLISANPLEPGVITGGNDADCRYRNFNGADAEFLAAFTGFIDRYNVLIGGAPSGPTAVEYFNAGFGHFFMTADGDEIAGLDAGAYNYAFVRTGRSFKVLDAPGANTVPVCRFFTTPGTFGAKSSHFYTANPAECDGLKLNPNWIYEKIAFHIAVPAGGVCAAGTVPVYRAYNHGQTGAPNHRFTTDLSVYQDFIANRGWDAEGIAFCAPS
jgi:hypothetical protein